MNRKVSRDQVLAAGRKFFKKIGGRDFTAIEFKRATGVDPGSVRNYFGNLSDLKAALGVKPAEITVNVEEQAKAKIIGDKGAALQRATVAELKRQLADAEKRATLADERVEFVTALGGKAPARYVIEAAAPRAGKLPEATYFACASDWHLGERVRKSEVGGINEYTPAIADARAAQYWKSNRIMLNAARSAWTIERAVLWLGGDLMTGWIHDEYIAENFESPLEEAFHVFDVIERGILEVLATWDVGELIVVTSNGNHGRMTQRKVIAGAWRTSFEFFVYRMLAKRFASDPRVKFQLGEGYYNVLSIYGRNVRFSHGDELQYGGGVGGITVPFYRRKGREADVLEPVPILVDVIGHHHTLGFPRRGVFNGSLIGATPYGVAKGFGAEAPMQASFVVDSRYGVVSNMNPILVEKARR